MEVGVRQLRDQLRHWLDAVSKGDEVVITERGRPIARLVGVSVPTALERLVAAGVVTRAQLPRRPDRTYRRVRSKGSVADLVAEQRR